MRSISKVDCWKMLSLVYHRRTYGWSLLCIFILFLCLSDQGSPFKFITDPNFIFGDEKVDYAIYRLIGNDMPPLQERGQLRLNTKYALQHEPLFPGARKRWILNRIWNETEFELVYRELISGGVNRKDIIIRCFNYSIYDSFSNMQEKLLYVTAQNEARNVGIIDGRNSGYKWSVMLDGNTFITGDSWVSLRSALDGAEISRQHYVKIPYHRVHIQQEDNWLNASTTLSTVLQYAPTKGESQIAFHRNASELFTLGDTNVEKKDSMNRRGYGQRNKSYMFKENGVCGLNATATCACSDVIDGNEEDVARLGLDALAYSSRCGLVLRLWNYPTADVIHTGLSADEEKGFFCFYQENRQLIRDHVRHHIECSILHDAVHIWKMKPIAEKKQFYAESEACKAAYHLIYLNESCFRYNDRQLAQSQTAINIENLYSKTSHSENSINLCQSLESNNRKYLSAFDEVTLSTERVKYQMRKETASIQLSSAHDQPDPNVLALVEYVDNLILQADYCVLLNASYDVTTKLRLPQDQSDARYYYSEKPTHWHKEDITTEMQQQLEQNNLEVTSDGYVVIEEGGAPGTVIGGPHEDYYDRAKSWYLIQNATTLALAWYFTDNITYAQYGSALVRRFFLDKQRGMLPSLSYARNGARTGIMDWKDLFVLMDAIVLFEWAGTFTSEDQRNMRLWSKEMIYWYMMSPQGREAGRSFTNHALIFDVSVLSLAVYAQIEPSADTTRSRLMYRLTNPAPLGHFALTGEPYYDIAKPTALHDATYTIMLWVHAASMVEAMRANEMPKGAISSLWWMRHAGDTTPKAQPVLLKAIQWLLRYLPASTNAYFTSSKVQTKNDLEANFNKKQDSLNSKYVFPYEQQSEYSYDRLLPILRTACRIYGVNRVFPKEELKNEEYAKRVNLALSMTLYNINVTSFTQLRGKVDASSGAKMWGELGLTEKRVLK